MSYEPNLVGFLLFIYTWGVVLSAIRLVMRRDIDMEDAVPKALLWPLSLVVALVKEAVLILGGR